MENKHTSITFKAKVTPIKPVNPEFTLCKVYVQSTNKNRNGSYMSKERILAMLPTLNYCPVVGHIIECTDNEGNKHKFIGGHDWTITEDWEIKDLTVPYGVVVEDSFNWEIVDEYGTDVEYLTANAIIWTGRYPELNETLYSDEIWWNQSMELNISQYRTLEEDSNYMELLEWTYSALCLLGKADADSTNGHTDPKEHTEPAFISAKVIPIEFSKSEFSNLMDEMKEKISFCFNNQTSNIGIDINSDKGGKNLDKKLEILQKFNKTVEELDFSIDEMSEEELETKMEELFGEKDPEPTTAPVVPSSEPIAFSATYNQKRQALRNALDPIVVKDEDGNYVEETYFYVEDFSDEYVYVEKDHWTDEDYKCTFGRFGYTFDEATLTATLTSEFEEMVKMWLTLEEKERLEKERLEKEAKFEALEKEFNEYKENYSVSNEEFEELKTYKSNKEAEERKFAEDTLFADYEETIGETEEFKALKEKASEFSLDALKKECLCIVGMYSMTNKSKETKKPDSLKFSFEPKEDDEEPYGGLFKKYLGK